MELYGTKAKTGINPTRFIIYGVIAVLISIFNLSVLNFMSISDITPDLMVILVVWIGLREGRFAGLLAGFGSGLILDLLTFDVIGINALCKTLVTFIAGTLHKEGKEDRYMGNFYFVLIVFLCAVVNNIVYYFFYVKAGNLDFVSFFMKYGLASGFYTTVVSLLTLLSRIPRRDINI